MTKVIQNAEKKLLPTNVPGLYKDTKTSVIINRNYGDYQRTVAMRNKKKDEDHLKEEVKQLKQDVKDLTSTVKELVTLLSSQRLYK